jgi:integrase
LSVKIRKRNGAWWVFICYRGRRKAKKIGTQKAARKVKVAIEARLALGDVGIFEEEKGSILFSDYGRQWLELHARAHCKPSTWQSYEQVFRVHLLPQFGSVPLDRITRGELKRFMSSLAASKQYGLVYSLGTLRNILATTRAILSEAVEDELIESNPALRLGKLVFAHARKRAVDFLTRQEAQQFLEATKALRRRRYPMFLTALRTGLRLGELIALRWDDIQFGDSEDDSNRYIMVSRNIPTGNSRRQRTKNHAAWI